MATFTSKYSVLVDPKGRVVLPSAFKRELKEGFSGVFVVEKDAYESCLNVYPLEVWEERVRDILQRLNPDDPRHSKFLSMYFEEIVKLTMAANGRLNIPNNMLDFAGIKKEAIFAGQGRRIRLWEPGRHKDYRLEREEYSSLFCEFLGGDAEGVL